MASKWDDEFDLDSQIDKKKTKVDNTKKNRNSTAYNEDYQDFDDTKKVKLPTITKPAIGNTQKSNKSTSNINLVDINKKKEQTGTKSKIKNYQEDDQGQFQQSVAPSPPQFKQKNQKIVPKETIQVQEKQVENSYGNQEFEEENYEQDFEASQVKKQSPIPFKAKQDSKRQSKAPVVVPKPPQKQKRAAQSTAKRNQIVAKGNSRTSVRSQSASRTSKSQNKPEQKKEDPPNKYVSLAEKNCQNYERSALQQLSLDKIVRQNDKIRNMIKKFNDELNDLINKNIMQLKTKKEEKVVNIDQILKVLEEQRSSNQIAYQNTVKDLQRLKGKQGQLKQEQYQLTIDQKINDAKISMTEIGKAIVKLKQQVNNEGNKLSKIDKQKEGTSNSQQINTIKNNIVLVKKQQEKNDQTLSKLYIKVEELTKKMSDTDSKLNGQLQQAKQKGISVQLNSEITKRFQQNKKKIENSKLHKSKIESLYKTKCEMINHECDQIKASIKLIENSMATSTSSCEEIKIQIKKIIQRAKKNAKMPQDLIKNLQTMISELQNGLTDQATFTHPKGAKKYQSQKNVEKINTLSVTAQRNAQKTQKQKLQQDAVSLKPAIFKKKQKEEQKQEERVWVDDKNTQVKKTQRISQSIPQLARFQQKQENEKKQQERKKPFMIKRNKQTIKTPELDNGAQSARAQAKQEKLQIRKEVEKEDQRPSIAPRMMKFKKNKPQQGIKQQDEKKNYETIEKSQQKVVVQQKLPQKIQEKIAEVDPEKPIFAPKRFNLKLKDKKTEDEGYVATSVKKQQPPKVIQQFKPKGLTVDKQPIFSQQKIQVAKQIQQPKLSVQEEQKPKFNLRLRDRQRESNKPQQAQIPQQQPTMKQPQQKISISLTDKNENISKQNNNPYSNPYANAQAPKREKQGPLKKQKPIQTNAKQNFSIYDQAQDLTNVKELKIGGESPKPPAKAAQAAQPSLQQLLGIKKNKNQVDPDLILDSKITEGRKKEVKSKKDTNFFGDLQL